MAVNPDSGLGRRAGLLAFSAFTKPEKEKSTKMLLDDGKRFVAFFDILGFSSLGRERWLNGGFHLRPMIPESNGPGQLTWERCPP